MSARRKILINPRLQYRIIFTFVGVAALCMAVQATLMLVAMTQIGDVMPTSPTAAGTLLTDTVLLYSGIGLILLVPLATVTGLIATLRIAGPLYRLERHLEAVCRGESPAPCRLRVSDECQHLCSLLNQALDLKAATIPGEGVVTELEATR